tara:strand:- start:3235 stop:3651 length:417 start_codon:yes stop_codon:yes gene_type:complete
LKSLRIKFWFPIVAILLGLALGCAPDDTTEDPLANRAKYLGVWQVTENTGINHPQFYSVNISAGTQDDEIVIAGLYNETGTNVVALISGNSMTIPNQNSGGISFQGSGQANASFSQISLSFTANDGSGPDNIEAVLVP